MADRGQIGRADSCRQQVGFRVEAVEGREDGVARGGAPFGQGCFDDGCLVLLAHRREQILEGLRGQLVVRGDGVGLDVGQGQQEQGNQAGPVPARAAVENDPAGDGPGNRGDGGGATFRLAVQERPEVQRRAVEPFTVEELPEPGVSDVIEGDLVG